MLFGIFRLFGETLVKHLSLFVSVCLYLTLFLG